MSNNWNNNWGFGSGSGGWGGYSYHDNSGSGGRQKYEYREVDSVNSGDEDGRKSKKVKHDSVARVENVEKVEGTGGTRGVEKNVKEIKDGVDKPKEIENVKKIEKSKKVEEVKEIKNVVKEKPKAESVETEGTKKVVFGPKNRGESLGRTDEELRLLGISKVLRDENNYLKRKNMENLDTEMVLKNDNVTLLKAVDLRDKRVRELKRENSQLKQKLQEVRTDALSVAKVFEKYWK